MPMPSSEPMTEQERIAELARRTAELEAWRRDIEEERRLSREQRANLLWRAEQLEKAEANIRAKLEEQARVLRAELAAEVDGLHGQAEKDRSNKVAWLAVGLSALTLLWEFARARGGP